jgi:hypothetical protein
MRILNLYKIRQHAICILYEYYKLDMFTYNKRDVTYNKK